MLKLPTLSQSTNTEFDNLPLWSDEERPLDEQATEILPILEEKFTIVSSCNFL